MTTVKPEAVDIYQPTVKEIRQYLDQVSADEYDIVNNLLFEECGLDDLVFLTSLTMDQIDEMTPSELHPIIDKAKQANPWFFELSRRTRNELTELFMAALQDRD